MDAGAWLTFPQATSTVHMRVGYSFVDAQGSANNLATEMAGLRLRARSRRSRRYLDGGAVRPRSASARHRRARGYADCYGALPRAAHAHADQRRRRALRGGGRQHRVGTERQYSDFSLWDTYRTLHPWLLLAEHPNNIRFAASLIRMGEEGGAVPQWSLAHNDIHSMIGSPGEIVLVESALKGVPLDELAAYDVARVTAFGPSPGQLGGRGAIDAYLTYGYVPSDLDSGSVSKTQEYAIADAALAGWARRLGRNADLPTLEANADSWRHLYHSESGFFRGKDSSGQWAPWPGATVPVACTWKRAWQYLWLVPHHPEGLAEVLGGAEIARQRLTEYFNLSLDEEPILGNRVYHWQGNEPAIVAPWFVHPLGRSGLHGPLGRLDLDELTAWAPMAYRATTTGAPCRAGFSLQPRACIRWPVRTATSWAYRAIRWSSYTAPAASCASRRRLIPART